MKIIKFKEFLLETVDYTISNLFRKFSEGLPEEKCSKEGLKESLSMIGNGVITYNDRHESFMYKEMLCNDTKIFVVHAQNTGTPYSKFPKGYWYDISIWENDPKDHFVGTGVILPVTKEIRHTCIDRYVTENEVYFNKEIISKVCKEIKLKYEVS